MKYRGFRSEEAEKSNFCNESLKNSDNDSFFRKTQHDKENNLKREENIF